MEVLCPCDSGKTYDNCCKIFHDGTFPENALLLMRSRYCAYAYCMAKYIIHTTHLKNPNYNQNHEQWIQEILSFCQNTKFNKLEVLDFIDGMDKAYVTFKAHLIQNNVKKELAEKSYFEKVGEQWLYRDGVYVKFK